MTRASFFSLALLSLILPSCKSVSLGGSEDAAGGVDAPAPVGTVQLTVTPPSVDFGALDVGVTSTPLVVTVTNAGTATSGPLTVTVSGDGIAASGCTGMTLAPQASCKISITAQGTGRSLSGTVEVGDTAANTKKIAVSAIITGFPGALTLSPIPLDLGSVPNGQTASGTIVVTNTSLVNVSGIVINVSGTGFSRSSTGTCTDTLASGQVCKIDVSFAAGATTLGPAKGTVTVSQGGVTKTVQVIATVVSIGDWFMEPRTASFQTMLGTPSSPVTFLVPRSDVSGAALTVTITGPNKDDFSFTTTCDQPAAKGSCQVVVVYNPRVRPATNSIATLTVAEPGPSGASTSAALTGTAINCGSGGGITGSQTDFGTVVVGGASKELTFTIANNGGADADGIEVSAGGDFAITTDNCTGKVLRTKTQCTFTAQFKPVEGDAGVIMGQLKAVLGTGPCSLSLAAVTGTAVPALDGGVRPVDANQATGCDVTKAAQALSAAGLTMVGEAQTMNDDLPTNLSAGANWGVKNVECSEGGYDLSAVAGKRVCLVSYDSAGLCQQLPAKVWVVMSDGIVRCIYQSASLNPGIYSVHDSSCSTPDAGVPSCPGPNPALRTCRSFATECIPSSCSCGSYGSWACTDDCRQPPLCADAGAAGDADACSNARIDNSKAATAFAQYERQLNPALNSATTFSAEEKTVPGLWDAMQAQLFFGKILAEDGTVWQEVAFLYRQCKVTPLTDDQWFGLVQSGVVVNGALYYSWEWGSGISRTSMGKIAPATPAGPGLVKTTSVAYLNRDLVVVLENEQLAVYQALVYWAKFNEWESRDSKPTGFLKDYGDRLAVVDESGKELSTTLP